MSERLHSIYFNVQEQQTKRRVSMIEIEVDDDGKIRSAWVDSEPVQDGWRPLEVIERLFDPDFLAQRAIELSIQRLEDEWIEREERRGLLLNEMRGEL